MFPASNVCVTATVTVLGFRGYCIRERGAQHSWAGMGSEREIGHNTHTQSRHIHILHHVLSLVDRI